MPLSRPELDAALGTENVDVDRSQFSVLSNQKLFGCVYEAILFSLNSS